MEKNEEVQLWKDRYFSLKKWVEGNLPENKNITQASQEDWDDFWNSIHDDSIDDEQTDWLD